MKSFKNFKMKHFEHGVKKRATSIEMSLSNKKKNYNIILNTVWHRN